MVLRSTSSFCYDKINRQSSLLLRTNLTNVCNDTSRDTVLVPVLATGSLKEENPKRTINKTDFLATLCPSNDYLDTKK
jgi:hypothetical protein